METDHRYFAAARSGAMDAGLRCLQDHPAISATQRRHESRRVQDDLLVGMEPPATRARDRGSLSAPISLVSVARCPGRGAAAPVVADFWPRRAAGRRWLVDGGVWTIATSRGFAISSRHSFGARVVDFCGHYLDAAAVGKAAAVRCIRAVENHGDDAAGTNLLADLSGGVGRRAARRQDLQHMARNGRRVDSLRDAAFL